MIKLQRGNSKQRIVAVDITDAEAQDMIAAKNLRCVVKIIETVRCHIIIRQGHERGPALRHQVGKMGVGDRQKLKPFGPATGFGS